MQVLHKVKIIKHVNFNSWNVYTINYYCLIEGLRFHECYIQLLSILVQRSGIGAYITTVYVALNHNYIIYIWQDGPDLVGEGGTPISKGSGAF